MFSRGTKEKGRDGVKESPWILLHSAFNGALMEVGHPLLMVKTRKMRRWFSPVGSWRPECVMT